MMRTINGALISLAAALISPAAQVLGSDNKVSPAATRCRLGIRRLPLCI